MTADQHAQAAVANLECSKLTPAQKQSGAGKDYIGWRQHQVKTNAT